MEFDPFKKNISQLNNLEPKKGLSLVSEPFMNDQHFERSVVYLAQHNNEGTVGFIISQKSQYTLTDIVKEIFNFNPTVYIGGPVQANNLFYIHTISDLSESSIAINDKLYWGGDFDQIISLCNSGQISSNQIKFFIGYSGWEPLQLKEELKQNSWFVLNTSNDLVMSNDTNSLWQNVLQKEREEIAIMSTFPQKPNLN